MGEKAEKIRNSGREIKRKKLLINKSEIIFKSRKLNRPERIFELKIKRNVNLFTEGSIFL